MLLKEILTHCVKPNIKQVFGQMTQISQYFFFSRIQFQSNCLSQQHNYFPLDKYNYSGLTTFCTQTYLVQFPYDQALHTWCYGRSTLARNTDGIELTASEVDAASFFLELAASLEKQEESMEKLVNWLQDNSESIED